MTATFENLSSSPAVAEALGRLRAATGGAGGPMERHCLRTRLIAAEFARKRGWAIDDELLTVAAILHDIGLYPSASHGGVYTAEGAALARELLADLGWSPARITRCAEAIDRHHELRSQLDHGPEVEALRRADLIDVSGGLVRGGIKREWLRALSREVPRRGLAGELGRQVGRAVRERPLTMLRIFVRSPLPEAP